MVLNKTKRQKAAQTPNNTYQLPEFLTRSEVAKIFKVTTVTVDSWLKCGVLTAYRIGSRVRFKPCDIEAAITAIPSKNKGVTHG